MIFGMTDNKKYKLVICTTVPDTILYILKGQPKYLKDYFEVVIITSNSDKTDRIRINENVIVYTISLKRNINLIFDFIALFQMLFLLIRIKPNIIHSYTPKAGLISMLSAKILNIPVRIHTFTGLIFPNQFGAKKQMLMLVDKLICYCSTKIIPEGLGVKNDLISYNITNKKLNLIGNGNIAGIDTKYFSDKIVDYEESLKTLELNQEILHDKIVFCFIGRLNVDKGLNELYNAFISMPDNAYLLIAGDLDKGGNSISLELYNMMKCNKRILFLGFVEDVRVVLKLSKVLILPSYREGFPNVLLQSLSMNVPAIATNINGCNEIIIHNYNGWLVEPKNYNDLANKMKFVASIDSSYFQEIKQNARKSIVDRFEQSSYRELLVKEYFKSA